MIWYRLKCLRGTSTTFETFDTWADGVVEAFEKARDAGLYPVSMMHCSSRPLVHIGGGLHVPISDTSTSKREADHGER